MPAAAAVSRQALVSQRLLDLAEDWCEGSMAPLAMALVEDSRFTPEELAQFRDLIESAATEASTDEPEEREGGQS